MENNIENFDINIVAAEFIKLNIQEFINLGKGILKGTKGAIQIKLKTVYSNYLKNVAERYGKSKSFFIRDEPQLLSSFYVPVGLQSSKYNIKTANLRAILSHNTKSIISGTAGSGKSVLLKFLLLNALNEKKQIPVFIELRDNNLFNISLLEHIKNTFESFGLDIESAFIDKAFSAGQFLLFLDGLDEVVIERRGIIIKEIDNLAKEYPKTSIIITTRPDELVSEFQTFSIFNTLPLTLEQSIALIDKLQADEHIKNKFISDLKNNLFKTHSSFLSNPLLLTIMLLTYGYSTDIPNKLSIFYNQAFEALFQRHDTMKGAYKRIRKTKLDIQDFEKILNVFCIQTYDNRKIQFSKQDALNYLDKSKKIVNIDFKSEGFLYDLLQSVCVLIEDGLFITFSHRSFQEYFASKFIVSSEGAMKKRLLEKYKADITDDSIFKLVHELDPDFLEYEIIYPFIIDLFDKIELKKKIGITHFLKFSSLMWSQFYFYNGESWAIVNNEDSINKIVRFILLNIVSSKNYKNLLLGKHTDWIQKQINESNKSVQRIVFNIAGSSTTDKIIIELFNSEHYFSKRLLELLFKVKSDLEKKRKVKSEKLEEFLFKKN